MKVSILRALAALIIGVALAACGGKATYDVSGTIAGLTNNGLILTNNGGDDLPVPAGASSFSFAHRISYGATYDVQIKQQPDHMKCGFSVIGLNQGSAGHTISISVPITCAQATHKLEGTVTGLSNCPATTQDAPYCLTLANGSSGGTLSIAKPAGGADNTPFTFGGEVKDGDSYGVTVLTQPTNMNCTVVNASGVMHTTDVGNVVVNCVPK